MKTTDNLYLIGPMGSGKTAVGRELAKALGRRFYDSDAEIERRTGVDIPFIFEKEGEAKFRERERECLAELTSYTGVVVATGGGAVLDPSTRRRLASTGVVIYLKTSIEDQLKRTRVNRNRPLLETADPRAVLERLAAERGPLYEEIACISIDTSGRQVKSIVAALKQRLTRGKPVDKCTAPCEPVAVDTLEVALGERSYPIYIGAGLLDDAELLRRTVSARQVAIVTNDVVAPLYLERVRRAFADRETCTIVLPDGEQHKTLATFGRILDELVDAEFHRDACLVALGGGVVGDVAGFAAACYQRGIDFVQVPTTLLAQVDSSVGGKTAVNHPRAKNMIGAFYQPIAVLADTGTLETLPPRELSAGLAEVVKYGLILDEALFEWLEANMEALRALDADALRFAIRRSCELKAQIVAEDEREHGRRALLNLGHTFGHALEALGGYERWLHGEAVAIGIMMAARVSAALGAITPTDCDRISALLVRGGLPVTASVDADAVLRLMRQDKKADSKGLKLVLLDAIGRARVGSAPPDAVIRDAISAR
ncbi:MAG TPA: 3-dehydroquinate synthase [Gammaproteobacteria bacterium]